jgi:hypothetical protein
VLGLHYLTHIEVYTGLKLGHVLVILVIIRVIIVVLHLFLLEFLPRPTKEASQVGFSDAQVPAPPDHAARAQE